jgi:hypothetical protein
MPQALVAGVRKPPRDETAIWAQFALTPARVTTGSAKNTEFWFLFGPGFHTNEPQFVRMLGKYALGKEMIGRVGDAWISAVERGREGRWARDCIVSCSTRRGFG